MPTDSNVLPLRRSDHDDAVPIAMKWLIQRHRKGWATAFDQLLDDLRPESAGEDFDPEQDLDEQALELLMINASEWMLARGDMRVGTGRRVINEYLLSRDGPRFTPEQQRWLQQLGERPLKLYRVTEVRAGTGITLAEEFDVTAEPVAVREISGSRSMQPGMLLGARLMPVDDQLVLSGALYVFAKLRESAVVAAVRAAEQGALQAGLLAHNACTLAGFEIARQWLAQWYEPIPMPELRDMATGEPILLVTDHYQVLDAAALTAVLATQADVTGDAQRGWHRNVDSGGGLLRSLAALNPGKSPDRLEIFYRTQRLADDGRAWFESLTGQSVRHLTREIADPRNSAVLPKGQDREPATPAIDPESLTATLQTFLQQQYAGWPDESLQALGGRTPRQAIESPAGLERVKGLLRGFESGEAQMARRDGRGEASFQFLWDALGIAR